MFTPERALTDEEIKHLNYVAAEALLCSRGNELMKAYDIRVWEGRKALTVYNELVREYVKMPEKCQDRPDLAEFVAAWPVYVKEYLGTDSWDYGYGFVGEVS